VGSVLDETILDEEVELVWCVGMAKNSSDGSSVYPEQSRNKFMSSSDKSEKEISDEEVARGLVWVIEGNKLELKGTADKKAIEEVLNGKAVPEKDVVLNSARGNKISLSSFVVADDK
jgi:hypothetical protein